MEDERVAHYLYADGPPCEAAFQDCTLLFAESGDEVTNGA
jgi:hypothetical protein